MTLESYVNANTDLLSTIELNPENTPSFAPLDALTGTVLANRYAIHEQVGRGGMSDVYRATDLCKEKTVAIKFDRNRQILDWDTHNNPMFNEGQALAILNHPNIISVYDFGRSESGTLYLVLEWSEGQTLSRCLTESPMSHQKALHLIDQVLSAIEATHNAGFTHGDISPNNIMVTKWDSETPIVQLIDYGLSQSISQAERLHRDNGLIRGTPTCMSPYRIRGESNDKYSDYYAIGVIFYRCLTGKYPFKGESTIETLRAHLQGVYRPICSMAKVPQSHYFQAFIDLLLDPEPTKGFIPKVQRQLKELHNALTRALHPRCSIVLTHQEELGI